MSNTWRCDFCGTVAEDKNVPDKWYQVYVHGDKDEESGFDHKHDMWDLCPDCIKFFINFMNGPRGDVFPKVG